MQWAREKNLHTYDVNVDPGAKAKHGGDVGAIKRNVLIRNSSEPFESASISKIFGAISTNHGSISNCPAVVSKSFRDYQGIVDKVAEEHENDSSSEDSESNWEDLDLNDNEDEISFQRRVDLRRVADRNARRKRHAARARKECEERERQERQERADRKREKERQERKKREREELDRKAAVKSKVYATRVPL